MCVEGKSVTQRQEPRPVSSPKPLKGRRSLDLNEHLQLLTISLIYISGIINMLIYLNDEGSKHNIYTYHTHYIV